MIKILGIIGGFLLATALTLAPAAADQGGALMIGPAAKAPAAEASVAEAPVANAQSAAFPVPAAANPASAPTPTPSGGPADSGTGENQEAKQTRVDYAPYVIGAVVGLTLAAGFLFWRKRSLSNPSKTK